MRGWEVWSTNNEVFDAVFPCLRELQIVDCPKLIEVSLKPLLSVEILRFRNIHGWKGWSTNREVSVLPCLRGLHIEKCPNLIEFSPEALPALEYLWFEDMLGWKMWSTNDAVFPCLRELHIIKCPQLIDVSVEALPSLMVLEIAKCGDGVLRSLVQAASSITKLKTSFISGLTYEVWRGIIEHIGAVEEVSIEKCNEIRYLWESEEEASKVLVNMKKLEVSKCSNLVSLGEKEEKDNFGSNLLSSLRILEVSNCDNMERCCCPNNIESLDIKWCSSLTHVSFPTAGATGGGGQKLKSLSILSCDKLMEKINNASMPMLESIGIWNWTNLKSIMQLGDFIYLTELYLYNCPSLESFPDIQLPVLTHLQIVECNSIESFPDIPLPVLTSLTIEECNSMESLCALQMKNLSSLEDLKIRKCRDVRNFRQLSTGLQHLTSLQHLFIEGCLKLKLLPKQLLPSLLSLTIDECPDLRKRCEGRGSHYYHPLISHIPNINIYPRLN
ncbi:putative leucine-rich repeat domain superfamily [Helianthus annuus]|nr:putative leucine-rich repeat domain superfamily [Helianthus annuus]